MLNLIKPKKGGSGKSKKEREKEKKEYRDMDQERPSSRSSCRSDRSDRDRPPSRSGRTKQPVLGVGTLAYQQQSGLFDEDPGIMSEVETSSSRLRRGAKERHSYVGSSARPRTSPSQPSRSPGPMSGNKMINNNLFEDDPGIMSEAETSSTRLKRGSSSNVSMATASLPRGGHVMMVPGNPQHSSMFDDDPGIMSEAETASTRRKNKPKAVLPVVRTPSKTLERPLVYRGETKRALLPNEITTIDTVKALFVRSFGRALTMEYLDSPRVKIYIHDSAKDIFYELENLSEIRDRTILKLFETDGSGRGPSGLGPAGLPPFTPTPYETGDFPSEPSYVTSAFVRDSKRGQKLSGDFDNACFSNSLMMGPQSDSGSSSSTLPRNVFSSRDQQYGQISVSNNFPGQSDTLPVSGRSMPARSKTLGPGFMRGRNESSGSSKSSSGSGYVSSPDNGGPDINTIRLTSRFSAIPETNYHGPVNAAEAKQRMMAMEQQLSQLSQMVTKELEAAKSKKSRFHQCIKVKKPGKKTVSFEKSVSFSDDPPPPPSAPAPSSILNKKNDRNSDERRSERERDRERERGDKSSKNSYSKAASDRNSDNERSLERKKSDKSDSRGHSVCSMEPELYNQLRGLQKSARELRQAGPHATHF